MEVDPYHWKAMTLFHSTYYNAYFKTLNLPELIYLQSHIRDLPLPVTMKRSLFDIKNCKQQLEHDRLTELRDRESSWVDTQTICPRHLELPTPSVQIQSVQNIAYTKLWHFSKIAFHIPQSYHFRGIHQTMHILGCIQCQERMTQEQFIQ
jgi:hypothetical protein